MAMYEEYHPTRSDIRKAFNTAAREGASYLAIIQEVLNDEMMVTSYAYTRPAQHASDIVQVLRAEDARSSYANVSLSHVLDLKKDFDAQIDKWGKGYADVVPAFVLGEIREFEKEKDVARQQAEWRRKPFLERLFSKPPSSPK